MIVLTREADQSIDLTLEDGRRIEVQVVRIRGSKVKLGIDAPRSIVVDRREVTDAKRNGPQQVGT